MALQLVKYISEGTVVELEDGRKGYLAAGRKFVRVSKDLGVEVKPTTRLTVLMYPAELSARYLMSIGEFKDRMKEKLT